jgi:putative hemolysin
VGDIFSEHERGLPEIIAREANGTAVVSGSAPVREINRALGLDLPDQGDWTTVAGLYLASAGKIPDPGDRLALPGGIVLEVVEASPRRVRSVRVHPPCAAS